MLFKRLTLDRIETGEVTVAFRKWRRPSVKKDGTLKTRVGLLGIDAVDIVDEKSITRSDARKAGHSDVADLRKDLEGREGDVYRVAFHRAGEDPRIALRENADLSGAEWDDLEKRLGRLDKASKSGPWTLAYLRLIRDNEATRAGDLAPQVDQERDKFKIKVRKLKNLGLTESLGTGYRLSPRGTTVLNRLSDR